MRKSEISDQNRSVGGRPRPDGAPQGLVFDFSGRQSPDIRDLSLLLTARMLADRDDRAVWVKALPFKTWEVLHALGLANLFRLFPSSGDAGN